MTVKSQEILGSLLDAAKRAGRAADEDPAVMLAEAKVLEEEATSRSPAEAEERVRLGMALCIKGPTNRAVGELPAQHEGHRSFHDRPQLPGKVDVIDVNSGATFIFE